MCFSADMLGGICPAAGAAFISNFGLLANFMFARFLWLLESDLSGAVSGVGGRELFHIPAHFCRTRGKVQGLAAHGRSAQE